MVGCMVFLIIILAAMASILISFYRSPYGKGLNDCKSRIMEVGSAINRYHTKQDRYPDSLMELVPDYIPEHALYCPTHKSAEYFYAKPSPDSNGRFIVLTCNNHKLNKELKLKAPGAVIHYHKDGTISIAPAKQEPGTETK